MTQEHAKLTQAQDRLRQMARHYYRAGLLSAQHALEVYGSCFLAYHGNDFRCALGASLEPEEVEESRGESGTNNGGWEADLQEAHDLWLRAVWDNSRTTNAPSQNLRQLEADFAATLGLPVNLR